MASLSRTSRARRDATVIEMKVSAGSRRRRPTAYDRGQHQLICQAIGVSDDPEAPGRTAYEGVCVLLAKLAVASKALRGVKTTEAREARRILAAPADSPAFMALKMF